MILFLKGVCDFSKFLKTNDFDSSRPMVGGRVVLTEGRGHSSIKENVPPHSQTHWFLGPEKTKARASI